MTKRSATINVTLNKDACVNFWLRYGYFVWYESNQKLIMHKRGTSFTNDLHQMSMELSFDFLPQSTIITIKYDLHTLFGGHRLQKELERIINIINENCERLI
ncbi:MAG: hypothetical protein ACRC37_01050 [Lentisphaeria bacterium]